MSASKNSLQIRSVPRIYWASGISGFLLLLLSPFLNANWLSIQFWSFVIADSFIIGLSVYGIWTKNREAWLFAGICVLGLVLLSYAVKLGESESSPAILMICTYATTLTIVAASGYGLFADSPNKDDL